MPEELSCLSACSTAMDGPRGWVGTKIYDIFEGTAEIQQLVIAWAISGWEIE
jgi:hypothetical protein